MACDGLKCRESLEKRWNNSESFTVYQTPRYFETTKLTLVRIIERFACGSECYMDQLYCQECRRCDDSKTTNGRLCATKSEYSHVEQCPFIHNNDENKQRPPGLSRGDISNIDAQRSISFENIQHRIDQQIERVSIVEFVIPERYESMTTHWACANNDERVVPYENKDAFIHTDDYIDATISDISVHHKCIVPWIWKHNQSVHTINYKGHLSHRNKHTMCVSHQCVTCTIVYPMCEMIKMFSILIVYYDTNKKLRTETIFHWNTPGQFVCWVCYRKLKTLQKRV